MNIDLQKYTEFVEAITSNTSNDKNDFIRRVMELSNDVNVPLIITSYTGLCGESGEFSEIFKKVIFHNKDFTAETKAHASKELGDIIWYWTNACRALGLDPNQVIADNVTKLEDRYPGGKFSAEASENRKDGDI